MAGTELEPGTYALISCEFTQYALDTKDGIGTPEYTHLIGSIAELRGPLAVAYPYIASQSQRVGPLSIIYSHSLTR
jgi:hypothetical protein